MKTLKNGKGFTLAELLIVIAIIAALVAIMIPTFGGQVEKAREAADLANLRAAYATATVYYLENSKDTVEVPVTITQTKSGWTSKPENLPFKLSGDIEEKPDKLTGNCKATFTFTNSGTPTVSVSK